MDSRPKTRIYTGPVANGTYRKKGSANHRNPRIYRANRRSRHATVPKSRRTRKLSLVFVAIAFTLAAAFAATALVTYLTEQGTDSKAQEEHADSTPRSEWKRGSMPYLYQIDRQWDDEPYAGGTVRKNGCGPTALSMVYVALTGHTDLDPASIAAFSERNGHVTNGMTAWTLMTDGAAQLGLVSEELSADVGAVEGALTHGHPIICSVRPGDFTTTGHFIVLEGLDENGQLIVHDPNSAERSGQRWGVDRVLAQCANLWAFSAA